MDTLVGSKTDDRFDVDGFLLDLQEWNPELAANLAELDGLQHLTQSH
jgi:sulfur relay (sulfurtransferase) DsrC/TusE family protein